MDNQQHRPTLLDVPISFFAYDQHRDSFANVPTQQTTLRRIGSTKFYHATIEAIRAETNKATQEQLKKQLPGITPVAWLHHRKKDTSFADKIRQQWPMLTGDIDKKDNPRLDMAELKTYIARLKYVLFCAHSVRGGLWFVVRLPDHQTPETLTEHFRYMQKLFSQKFGVELDKSKGSNPTHLRFVSYDADPYINEAAVEMRGKFTPKPPIPRPVDASRFNKQDEGDQLITQLVRFAEKSGPGTHYHTLSKVATLAGGFIAASRLDESTAVVALEAVASQWRDYKKNQRLIWDCIQYGKTKPTYADETPPCTHRPPPAKPRPLIVRTLAEWGANPGSSLRPDECQLERLSVEPCDHYPAEWDL